MGKKSARGMQAGVTPIKLILVGVLSVVLIGVVYLQFGSSPPTPAVAAGSAARRPVAAAQSSAPQAAIVPSASAVKKEQATPADASVIKADISSNWQAANLASVVKYDPFALPASFPQRPKPGDEEKTAQETVKTEDAKAVEAARVEAIKAVQAQFVELQHQGVRIVMLRQDKYVALVGERTIHVGDEIDGFTVIAIDASGIRVARDLKQ
jgi:hypothetical protein